MKEIIWNQLCAADKALALKRPVQSFANDQKQIVSDILKEIRTSGDKALKNFTEKFDGVKIDEFRVTVKEIDQAESIVTDKTKEAIKVAILNIEKFHVAQLPRTIEVETQRGVRCSRKSFPIEKVGLYVPGGSAPLLSTVMMLAIPAKIAGCELKILCTPPQKDGTIDPNVLLAAKFTGIDEIYKLGGAQAIAAMAYGTDSIPKVDKIFGPGNSWVTEAKIQVAQDSLGASIDLPAGPSEVLVIADSSSNPKFLAADLLSQAEHGPDSQVLLLCHDEKILVETKTEVLLQVEKLPRREIALESLEHSIFIKTQNLNQSLEVSNSYCPEHLILNFLGAEKVSSKIKNAGSVFLGPWTPESVGDYASGTNHVLPTYGYAKTISGLSLDDFMKNITFQSLDENALLNLGPIVETLAELEGLEAHKNAISIRLESLKDVKINAEPLNDLALQNVKDMKPYTSARSLVSSQDDLNFLDANESPFEPKLQPNQKSILNRYPEPQPKELLKELSKLYEVNIDQLTVGRGVDEGIDLLIRGFAKPEVDKIIICPPTYGVYEIFANLCNVETLKVPLLSNFNVNWGDLIDDSQMSVKLVFLCSPNNPTGNCVEPQKVIELCNELMGRALVVLDEAYIEFSQQKSLASKTRKVKNLVVLRTLSKAWGMAGLRIGTVIAHPEVTQILQKIRSPYPLPALCSEAATSVLKSNFLVENLSKIKSEKEKLMKNLSEFSFVEKIYKSEANFLLIRFRDSQLILKNCREKGIILRDRSNIEGLENCLRISVGSLKENDLLISCLKNLAQGAKSS